MTMQIIRGRVLALLHYVYPTGAPWASVLTVWRDYHTYKEIKQALHYLVDSGLVVCECKPHPYKNGCSVNIYKITPTGIRVSERTETYAGVEMEVL
jgi:hypothetical protein